MVTTITPVKIDLISQDEVSSQGKAEQAKEMLLSPLPMATLEPEASLDQKRVESPQPQP